MPARNFKHNPLLKYEIINKQDAPSCRARFDLSATASTDGENREGKSE